MRTSRLFLPLVACAAVTAFLLQAPAASPAAVGGPPPLRVFRSACAGKPAPRLGDLRLAVVERPLGDEAVVRCDWSRGPLGDGCRLVLVLPDGATLLEGESDQALPEGLQAGVATWRVRFPTRCTSDLTVRLCAQIEGQSASRETYARLWECE